MNIRSLFIRAFNESSFHIGLATSGDRSWRKTSKGRTLIKSLFRYSQYQTSGVIISKAVSMNIRSLFIRAFNETTFHIGLANSGDRSWRKTSKGRTLIKSLFRYSQYQNKDVVCTADLTVEEHKHLRMGIFHLAFP